MEAWKLPEKGMDFRSGWRSAWMVRSRQMETDFAFWLALLGYNRRDKSLSHRIYLVYAGIFFSFWGFAVLSLFSEITANLLMTIQPGSPVQAAPAVVALLLLTWGLYRLHHALKRSPLVFSEEDAYLICKTPLNRRAVVLSWFPEPWIASGLLFWACGVILGFASLDIQMRGHVTLADVPLYIFSGLRVLTVVVPLQLAILAGIWAAGAARLKPNWNHPKGYLFSPALGVILAFAAWGAVQGCAAGSLACTFGTGFLWLWLEPLWAGFGLVPWGGGFIVALLEAAVGLSALAWLSGGVVLALAAQETAGREVGQAASLLGQSNLAHQIAQREKLGAGRAPSRLPDASGFWALAWKQALQSRRSPGWLPILSWIMLLGFSLGIALAPDWQARLGAAVGWIILVAQRSVHGLRSDLAQWWLLRQMPFSSKRLLAAELGMPWALAVLLTWIAIALSSSMPLATRLFLGLLTPGGAAVVAFAAAYDLIRQCRATLLLNGVSSDISALGVIIALITLGLSVGIYPLLGYSWAGAAFALFANLLLAFLLWDLAANTLRRME